MLLDEINRCASFVIYGAQVVAYGAFRAICELTGKKPECFVVSSLEGNPGAIDGIPVRLCRDAGRDALVLVAVTELLHQEVEAQLKAEGFNSYILLTQQREHALMSRYYESLGKFSPAKAQAGYIFPDFALYEVCNHRDKPLKSHPALYPYETDIQAGAALTDRRIARLTDDSGENISRKNRQYCEMSAAYWIWKNGLHDWTGLEHYRRHLLVTPEMLHEDVDAILPLPYLCYPDAAAQLRRFISPAVFNAMLQALEALHPREYQAYHAILHGPYQYTYNMVCARKQVYADYCKWFFEITSCMEDMSGQVPEIANSRALSYVAEALTNIYFMHNAQGWKLAHAGKEIYV